MERILKDDEKIRKAEEIYYRRNHRNLLMAQGREPKRQKTYLGSKILLEMLILLLLAVIVFAVKNKDYIFTENFLNSCAQYNINLSEKFNFIFAYFKEEEEGEEVFVNSQPSNLVENPVAENPQTNSNPENQSQPESTEVKEVPGEENQANSAQSVITDSISLKNTYTFTKPIEGIVTSNFGSKEAQYQNITGAHTGIDLASDSGTPIKSAMSGTVTQVSSEGDYGNHIRISKGNITTLYAHCQNIYVAEGQEITEGQEIATVGSTGNSTGPHLHFEIRIDNTPINPAEIIDF